MKKVISLFLSFTIGITAVLSGGVSRGYAEEVAGQQENATQPTTSVKPEESKEPGNAGETPSTSVSTDSAVQTSKATLRLMYTTDIHGKVTSYDYQTSKETENGLSRIYTMMKQARTEAGSSNYMSFDIGDNIMDYNTDYIYSQSTTALQPVYKALSLMGYDAITLGNHEFDYGYDYLVSQLEQSGLMSKVVLSNVTSKYNGEYVFGVENKIVNKTVVDNNGKKRTIKVGLFGVTPPSMSTRTEKSKMNLKSEDIVVCAKREAKLLKSKGADIVIALAHSGFGVENPKTDASNVDYALTKINEIDVILGGHEHTYFPTSSASDKHYKLPNVDKDTGLVNGKRLMILRDSARSLGIVDLKFKIDDKGKVTLDGSDYEIRRATKKIEADSKITDTMKEWGKKLTTYSSKVVGNIKDGERWQSYTGLLEDAELIQVAQNAEIEFASNYIMSSATQYKNYPIVSMVRYPKYGSEGGTDYSDLSGKMMAGDVNSVSKYHCTLSLYEITGKQLKEWLEWSASIYQTINTSKDETWDDLIIDSFIKETGHDSLITDEALVNWSRLFRCEGVEYTVNPSVPPRYNYEGKKISDYERITSMTLNGEAIADDKKFILASEGIGNLECDGTAGLTSQRILRSRIILQNVMYDYVARQGLKGNLSVNPNRNWKLDLPDGYNFIMMTGAAGDEVIRQQDWYDGMYANMGDFNYYKCTYHKNDTEVDKQPPGVVLSSSNWEVTNSPVTVSVVAHDISGISEIKYASGNVDVNDKIWADTSTGSGVSIVSDNCFTVKDNGAYSVYVKDNAGNAIVETIGIDNINPGTLLKPVVNKVDNNDVVVTGTGAAGMTICLTIGNKTYTGNIDIYGKFSVTIPPFSAGRVMYAYVRDKSGKTSAKTKITIKRAGPNCPLFTSVNNNGITIAGKLNDKNVKIYAVIGSTVYVSKKWGTSYYKKCKKYNKNNKIVKTDFSIKSDGRFYIRIPNQKAGKKVKIVSIDKLGRASYPRQTSVKRVAPDQVKIETGYSYEKYVYGQVPNVTKKCYVVVTIGKKSYTGYSDKEGYYAVKTVKLEKDMKVTVRAKDTRLSKQQSYAKTMKAADILKAYKKYKRLSVTAQRITAKDKVLMGETSNDYSGYKVCAASQVSADYSKIDEIGEFKIRLTKRQPGKSYVYIVIRNKYGRLQAVNRKFVYELKPSAPKFNGKLRAKDDTVTVFTKKPYTVRIKVGQKIYKKSKMVHRVSANDYKYTFAVKKLRKGQKVLAYAKNTGGTAKSKPVEVIEAKKVVKKPKKASKSGAAKKAGTPNKTKKAGTAKKSGTASKAGAATKTGTSNKTVKDKNN